MVFVTSVHIQLVRIQTHILTYLQWKLGIVVYLKRSETEKQGSLYYSHSTSICSAYIPGSE